MSFRGGCGAFENFLSLCFRFFVIVCDKKKKKLKYQKSDCARGSRRRQTGRGLATDVKRKTVARRRRRMEIGDNSARIRRWVCGKVNTLFVSDILIKLGGPRLGSTRRPLRHRPTDAPVWPTGSHHPVSHCSRPVEVVAHDSHACRGTVVPCAHEPRGSVRARTPTDRARSIRTCRGGKRSCRANAASPASSARSRHSKFGAFGITKRLKTEQYDIIIIIYTHIHRKRLDERLVIVVSDR